MMKYWKGKHIILKKQDEIEEYIDRVKRRDMAHKEIDKKCLKWAPFTPTQPQNSSWKKKKKEKVKSREIKNIK